MDVKGKNKFNRDIISKKKHFQTKIKIDPIDKELVSTLIKIRTPPNILFKLKKNYTPQKKKRKSY